MAKLEIREAILIVPKEKKKEQNKETGFHNASFQAKNFVYKKTKDYL